MLYFNRKEDAYCIVTREEALGPHVAVTDQELFGKYILRLYYSIGLLYVSREQSRPEVAEH